VAVEFDIGSGRANLYRASDELDLGRALTAVMASGAGFAPRTFDIVLPDSAPLPEPATLLLIGSGLIGLAVRRKRRLS
jgi:hypothetical protein